jgi:hypothetical protein
MLLRRCIVALREEMAMRMIKALLAGTAMVAGPASACALDGMYGHRFSSLMSEYQRPADSGYTPDSWGAAQQESQDQQSSGNTEQPSADPRADYGQGEPTDR